jgi:hypothetical protein
MAIEIESIARNRWQVKLNGQYVGSISYKPTLTGCWRGYMAPTDALVCELYDSMHPTWKVNDFLNECSVNIVAARAGQVPLLPSKKTISELVMELEGFASAGAEGDLRFAGDEALKSMVRNPGHRAKLRTAMLLFAQMSASRVVKELARRGFLNTEKVKIR